MYNIALIGAGQLGSRHLQGLKKTNIDMSIYVVDNNPQSLKLSKERYNEVNANLRIKSIEYLTDISHLPSKLDLVIIATISLSRANITKYLIEKKSITNIIFEKFLFPSIFEYSIINNLLINKNINAWVNCSRRCFTFYKELKELLLNSNKMKMQIKGSDWGLACNSIHFIDLFSMLTKKQDFTIDTSLLENIINSKRKGYIELTGSIIGKSISGDYNFLLTSKKNIPYFTINIITENYNISIFEDQLKAYIISLDGNNIEKEVKIIYQSELTEILAEQILLNGNSDLPRYEESSKLHLQFLKPIIDFYNTKTGENKDFCPIT